MKRKSIFLIAALMLSACGSPAPAENPTEANSVETGSATDDSTSVPESSTDESQTESSEPDSSGSVTLSEQEIYNQNDIIVTVTGFDMDETFGPEISVLIENNSDKGITVQPRNSSVNGYMIDLQMSCDVAPGKKANDSLDIFQSELDACGIDTISEIDFSLHFIETDSFETLFDSDMINLQTSAYGTFEQTYDDSGDLLYEGDGIRIVLKGLVTDDSIFGPEVFFYIENNSESGITVQVRDTSVNGFMVDPSFSADVAPSKKCVDSLSFLSSQLEENDITSIDTLETSFHIFNSDSWDTIIDTDPVIINFN